MAVSLTTMYAPQNNGPHTALAEAINAAQTDITVVDASVLPAAPNVLTIGTGEDAELVLGYKPGNTDVTSGELELAGYKSIFEQMAITALRRKAGRRTSGCTARSLRRM